MTYTTTYVKAVRGHMSRRRLGMSHLSMCVKIRIWLCLEEMLICRHFGIQMLNELKIEF